MRQIVNCLRRGICQTRLVPARWHPGHSVDFDVRLTMRSRSKAIISTRRFVIVTIVIESAGRFPLLKIGALGAVA